MQNFYGSLYRAEEESKINKIRRDELLKLIDKKLTEENNRKLEEVPNEELIEQMVWELPGEKSPGHDGVIPEVLVARWGFMKPVCVHMVQEVWRRKKLLKKDLKGVIKLISKNELRHFLKN